MNLSPRVANTVKPDPYTNNEADRAAAIAVQGNVMFSGHRSHDAL